MRNTVLTIPAVIAFLFMLASCAYMQSHKSVQELGTYHVGSELRQDNLSLYSSNGQWYVAAPKVKMKRNYPLFHDAVYGSEESCSPVEKPIPGTEDGLLYMPISQGTAQVLQRADGYCDLPSLLLESTETGRPALDNLPHATRHTISATIDSKDKTPHYIYQTVPEKPSTTLSVLSTLDKYTVDVVGTLGYNIVIPLVAPFRFFWDFLHED